MQTLRQAHAAETLPHDCSRRLNCRLCSFWLALQYSSSLTVARISAGTKPSPRRRAALAKLHPGGLTDDWADKLVDQSFTSTNQKVTHEHYSQV